MSPRQKRGLETVGYRSGYVCCGNLVKILVTDEPSSMMWLTLLLSQVASPVYLRPGSIVVRKIRRRF